MSHTTEKQKAPRKQGQENWPWWERDAAAIPLIVLAIVFFPITILLGFAFFCGMLVLSFLGAIFDGGSDDTLGKPLI
jgi:hypothetical protein